MQELYNVVQKYDTGFSQTKLMYENGIYLVMLNRCLHTELLRLLPLPRYCRI